MSAMHNSAEKRNKNLWHLTKVQSTLWNFPHFSSCWTALLLHDRPVSHLHLPRHIQNSCKQMIRWFGRPWEIKCEACFAISARIAIGTCQSVSPREGQEFFSGTTNVNTTYRSDKVFFTDVIALNIRLNSLLYVFSDICSYASAHKCRTRNKSDYGVHGVMFNNKKYYLPRSICVAVAIKCNEWKVLEGCSKFWCVVILNTLWQHTARQGCKTSSNRL